MKRVLLVGLIALGLQSCTIKEEYVIYEDGKIDYNYSLNGNDFWESGVVCPDLVLADLIRIFHPELNLGGELYYYRKL